MTTTHTDAEDDGAYLRTFVRHFPGEMTLDDALKNPLVLCDEKMSVEEVEAAISIEQRLAGFQKTRNPVLAFEVFVHSMRAGLHPPKEVLRWLQACFEEHHNEQGKKSMDSILGLSSRGKTPPYKALLIEQRNEMLFIDMDVLIHLGATRDQAAEMVAAKLEQSDWNKSGYDMADPNADTLSDMHSRLEKSTVHPTALERFDDRGDAATFLMKFPTKCLPAKLRALLD